MFPAKPRSVAIVKYAANTRVGITLAHGSTKDAVVVDSVSRASPLFGKVFPGDHVLECSNLGVANSPATVAREISRASGLLTLRVASPFEHCGTVSFFKEGHHAVEELALETDAATGRPVVERTTTPIFSHYLELDAASLLEPGDVILAITTSSGSQERVGSAKEVMAKMRDAPDGPIELRVARRDAFPSATPLAKLAGDQVLSFDESASNPGASGRTSPLLYSSSDLDSDSAGGSVGATPRGSVDYGSGLDGSSSSDPTITAAAELVSRATLSSERTRPPSPVEGSYWRRREASMRARARAAQGGNPWGLKAGNGGVKSRMRAR